jgi:hypothetical protein
MIAPISAGLGPAARIWLRFRTMVIHQRILPSGAYEDTRLDCRDGEIHLEVDGGPSGTLPLADLKAVMRRYGKPLSQAIPAESAALELPDGILLHLLRHRARYDVIAKDFLVLAAPGEEPVAELSSSVSAALLFLLEARSAKARDRDASGG